MDRLALDRRKDSSRFKIRKKNQGLRWTESVGGGTGY